MRLVYSAIQMKYLSRQSIFIETNGYGTLQKLSRAFKSNNLRSRFINIRTPLS